MVDRLIQARNRQKGQSVAAYGAGESFVDLLDQLIRYLHTKKPEINFFEAGVGTGYILRAVHQLGGVHVSGCDVCLDRQLLGELSSCCIEKTLYAALGELKDGSVDLFYWNDVMEHLPEDEMEETLRQIAKKLSPEGLLVTVTPSRGMGPHDITKLAAPKEREAKGLHLREYCYYEVVEQNQRAGCSPESMRCGTAIHAVWILSRARPAAWPMLRQKSGVSVCARIFQSLEESPSGSG